MSDDTLQVLVLLVVAMMVVAVIGFWILGAQADARCKAHGWREGSVTLDLKQYCHREENEFEITVPIDSVS